METYAERITTEYNKWNNRYNKAVRNGTMTDQGVAAFMCNAISTAIARSSHREVREYFMANAETN